MAEWKMFRPGLRSKLLLLSSLLLALPWFGFQYIQEMENYLQRGQEQTVASMAQALALTLDDKPLLFRNMDDNDQKTRLYVYPLPFVPDVTDGSLDDWQGFRQHEIVIHEGSTEPWAGNARTTYRKAGGVGDPLELHLLVGENQHKLFLYLRVLDQYVVHARANAVQVRGQDGVLLSLVSGDGVLNHYRLSVQSDGNVQAWHQDAEAPDAQAWSLESRITGHYVESDTGYDYELQLPVTLAERSLVVTAEDVDDRESGALAAVVATGDANATEATLQRPANELETLLAGQPLTNFRVRVYDRSEQLLYQRGNIREAFGLVIPERSSDGNATWRWLRTHLLHPLYDDLLTWLDQHTGPLQLPDVQEQSAQLMAALQGAAQSGYRSDSASSLRTLEAAWPITVKGQVAGAVLVDQNLTGLHSARNQSLASLFDAMLAILVLTIAVLLVFAGSLSQRIRALRDQAESSIDEQGRLARSVEASRNSDEIGDLSRSIANMVERIGHYNQYLENLTARLSHELRTPVTVVRSSLENLRLLQHSDAEAELYIQRAEEGISRLNLILANMSEATRLEQILQGSEKERLALDKVFAACVQQYRQIYPATRFESSISSTPLWVMGSAEHLVQLLDKVVANAVEFSRAGRPIRLVCREDSGDAVMSVSNSGPYLDPAMKDRIFDSMVSVRPQGSRGLPHLGLGLHIARLIAEFHQGYIYAENLMEEPGVIVVVRLPLAH